MIRLVIPTPTSSQKKQNSNANQVHKELLLFSGQFHIYEVNCKALLVFIIIEVNKEIEQNLISHNHSDQQK